MNSVEVIVEGDPGGLAGRTADVVQEYLGSTRDPVLGLATGASVRPLYRELIRRHHRQQLSFSRVRSVLLDDYIGLGPEHPQCYGNLIKTEFARHVEYRT